MSYQNYQVTFCQRSLSVVGIDIIHSPEQLVDALYENFNLVPVHYWWKEVYQKYGIYLEKLRSLPTDERYLAHIDFDNHTIEIVGTTKNCVTWLNSEDADKQTPIGFYEALLENLEEIPGLSAIVPYWDTKVVYENDKHLVLMDSDGCLYLIDKTK